MEAEPKRKGKGKEGFEINWRRHSDLRNDYKRPGVATPGLALLRLAWPGLALSGSHLRGPSRAAPPPAARECEGHPADASLWDPPGPAHSFGYDEV